MFLFSFSIFCFLFFFCLKRLKGNGKAEGLVVSHLQSHVSLAMASRLTHSTFFARIFLRHLSFFFFFSFCRMEECLIFSRSCSLFSCQLLNHIV